MSRALAAGQTRGTARTNQARTPTTVEPIFTRSVLPNGLRIVTQPIPLGRSVSVGLFVGVGSRHEDDAHAGLSHLLEHLVFKGTRGFPDAGALSETIEGVGGSVNASTDRELTVYSAKVPRQAWRRALEVVAELCLRPLLRRRDLAAEKPVIVDEIRMYIDSPADHIFTLFDELLFGAHPLGREIAGSPGSVRRATADLVRSHWEAWYRPPHLVLAVAGPVEHEAVVEIARGWFSDETHEPPTPIGRPRTQPPTPTAPGTVKVAHRRLGQANLLLGMPGVARDDPDRWALDLLGAVLGDGMSSRLFLELRERRSLAYDISTFGSMYADCGTFGINAGFDPAQANAIVRAILEQLERVAQEPVLETELERARAYTRGRLELRMEESGAVVAWLGTGESLLPRILSVEEVVEQLAAVSTEDLLRVAQRYARPELARLAVLGPFRGSRRFERLLPG
ncbi:MAG: M16 family metallopeptidase [Candidatus Limnocylindria bacterium]